MACLGTSFLTSRSGPGLATPTVTPVATPTRRATAWYRRRAASSRPRISPCLRRVCAPASPPAEHGLGAAALSAAQVASAAVVPRGPRQRMVFGSTLRCRQGAIDRCRFAASGSHHLGVVLLGPPAGLLGRIERIVSFREGSPRPTRKRTAAPSPQLANQPGV